MLTAERRQFILDQLRREGKVLASELSSALAVSEDTIRRDLRELSEAGLLQRVHGGALPRSPGIASYAVRQRQAPQAKAAIAQAALQLIRSGQVLLLDGGTTTLHMAQRLPYDLQATVVTNSPPIAEALADHPCAEVVLIGGRLFKHSRVVVGAAATEAIRSIRADLCILGVCSLHPEVGISVTDLEEAHTKRAMIAVSAEVVALADSEKLGTVAPYVVGPLSELTQIITDRCVPETTLAPYRAQGVAILQG
ncbi:MAG TPA: DeoR/GlpR family DNA-binding transcription regulator [Roseiflexaceae bacterium]|nr:DeoR/GlpR family DNA-binding transcription regulator [Roseiflexaceae bacterium]